MIRLLSLFSGIGAFEKALERENIPFELVGFSEINKYAIKGYKQLHNINDDVYLGDIKKINNPPDCDLLVHGTPCTSFSVLGKQEGGDEGSGTESSLMWYSVSIIKKVKPKWIIWENVPNVLSNKHRHNFEKYLNTLEDLGYTNSYEILDACEFDVPQSRKRIFCVSIYGDKKFEFPKGSLTKKVFKDILEDSVDDSYYLSADKIKEIKWNTECVKGCRLHEIGSMPYLTKYKAASRLYGINGLAPTLTTCQGGWMKPKVACAIRGRYIKNGSTKQCFEFRKDELSNALCTVPKNYMLSDGSAVRYLTPRECGRLMGYEDEDIDRLYGISNNQLYILFGNSIVVNVLQAIFRKLFIEENKL